MKNNRGTIIVGIFLVLLGGWLLAQQMGVRVPSFTQLWPGVLILAGAGLLISFIQDRQPDQIFWGVAALLLGGFFFLFTLGLFNWQSDMARYWPVFLIIFSIASVFQWFTNPARRGYLAQAGLALLIGLFFLAYNFNLFSRFLAQQILQLWPLLVILAGLVVVARALRRADN